MADRDLRILKAALRYARRGWRVFPLNGKRPYSRTHGHNDATTDRQQIRRWWREYPDANVGIACNSQSGPIVIDADGPSAKLMLDQFDLPETREVRTRRGRHFYFDPTPDGDDVGRHIKPFKAKDGAKIELDILGDGGYVVAPPSIHPDTGKPYIWTRKVEIVPLPASVLALLFSALKRSQNGKHGNAPPLPDIITEGERDNTLTSLAGTMRRRGADEATILAALREMNTNRVDPPMDDRDLRRIAKSIARKPPAGHGEHLTDLGNARRFVQQHKGNVHAVQSWKNPWVIWEGTRWSSDDTGEVSRFAKSTVRLLYQEANHAGDEELRDQVLKHASKSEAAGKIRAITEVAATEPEIALPGDAFDADPWLLNVENGTLDLKTGKLQPHDKTNLITKLAPVEFDPSAKAPMWEQFLDDITDSDSDLQEYLQRAAGYTLTGNTDEECLFFCYGQGANGKTTFFEVMRAVMGDYAQQADFNTFLARRSEGPRNDIARMRGARFVSAVEAQGEKGFDEGTLLILTGNDTVTARKLYEEAQEFKPTHKLWLAANHKPIVKVQTEGFWRRMRLIPFTVTIPKEKRIGKLSEKIARKELAGVLNWALAGTKRWRKEHLAEPRIIVKATDSYKDENDLLGEFFPAKAVLSEESWTSTTELYRVFTEWWMETRGMRATPISMGWFGRLLGERNELKAAKRHKIRGWKGIAILIGGNK